MRRMVIAALLVVPLVGLAQAQPAEQTFRFGDKVSGSAVGFTIHAPFEKITGNTQTLNGEVRLAQDKVTSATFKVPVNSIKTGSDLRDEHLLEERWMHAEKHPEILFTLKDLKLPSPLVPGQPLKVVTEGEFTIRGVKRKEKVTLTATLHPESEETRRRAPGDLLQISATARIPIEQYGIKRAQAFVLKVGEIANVTVEAWGSAATAATPKAEVTRSSQP